LTVGASLCIKIRRIIRFFTVAGALASASFFVQKCYNQVMNSEILKGLNNQQEQAITFTGGPLLIIAGAGTGKTTVLTRRIVWLLEQGLAKSEEILALTFTEKAATEMAERVDLLMPLGYADIQISTFHSFAQKILTQHALDIGLPGDFKVITDIQAWMLVKKHLYDFDLDYYKPIGNPNRFIYSLLKHFHKAKGEEITPEEYLKYAEGLSLNQDRIWKVKGKKSKIKTSEKGNQTDNSRILEVANAYHKYQKLLLDQGYLDFGDLINYTLKLFRTRPKILEFYQKQFKYVLVDEFQDTDWSQYELVKLLSQPDNNITVVGDDDQSIYKFRGASVSNILKFKEDYPTAQEITLIENYRSTQNILDLSYKFIQQNNPERLEPKLKISKKLVSNNNDKGEIAVIHSRTVYDESREVIDKILQIKKLENLNFNDFAILVRANDHAEPFLAEASRRGLPFIFVANRGLYKKPYILDLLAYFRLLDNYHESENLYRVLKIPKFKISEEELVLLSQLAKKKAWSLYESLTIGRPFVKLSNQTQSKLDELVNLIKKHTLEASNLPISELLVKVLSDLGLLKALAEDSISNVENRGLVEKLYRKSQKYEEENDDKSLKGFLNQINLEIEAGDMGELSVSPEAGPEAVKIMTIHAAKGLEFGCVFVVNLVDQRFPTRERKDPIEIPDELVKEILPEGDVHLMEERRLFYVAATRAKRFLFFTFADDYGGITHKKPSRFLVELSLAEKVDKQLPAGEVFFTKQMPLINSDYQYPIPDTFSFSQISTFLHCPLEYKLKYVYRLPLPGEAQLSFGITMHKTLEKYLQAMIQINTKNQPDLFSKVTSKGNKLELPKKELLQKFYEESWIDDWFPDKINKEQYRKKGLKLLVNFYEKFSKEPKLPKFLEKKFKLKLGNYKFTGKIDRGDQNLDGSINIVDYKTGTVKEKLSPVDKEQLMIYQWAATEEFGEKVETLTYWYLDGLGSSSAFLGTSADIDALKSKLLSTIEQIIATIQTDNFLEADRRISHECKFRHFEAKLL